MALGDDASRLFPSRGPPSAYTASQALCTDERVWKALPRDVSAWWRRRADSTFVASMGSGRSRALPWARQLSVLSRRAGSSTVTPHSGRRVRQRLVPPTRGIFVDRLHQASLADCVARCLGPEVRVDGSSSVAPQPLLNERSPAFQASERNRVHSVVAVRPPTESRARTGHDSVVSGASHAPSAVLVDHCPLPDKENRSGDRRLPTLASKETQTRLDHSLPQ